MIAIATLLAAVLVSLVVTRMATILLTVTGMPREAARFQARSAFTGVGFTTSESEQLVNHPVRRRVVMFLMLLGNAGVVAVLGSAIIGFAGEANAGQTATRIGVVLGGLVALWLLGRSAWLDRVLSTRARRWIERHYGVELRDHAALLPIAGDWYVGELFVRPGDWLAGKTIGDMKLREEGITVLGVMRAGGVYEPSTTGETRVLSGDTLILYGRGPRIADLDQRPAGGHGEHAHRLAKVEHQREKDVVSELGQEEAAS